MRRLDIVSGPSGAGKSTFVAHQSDWSNIANIDTLERELGSRELAVTAMEEVIWDAIGAGEHLVIDHVVDTDAIERWIEPAIEYGYQATAWLMANDHPEVQMTRVRHRKHHGGHGGDDREVRALHSQALGAFGTLTLLCQHNVLIDTARTEPAIAAIIERFEYTTYTEQCPTWAQELTEGLTHKSTNPQWLAPAAKRLGATHEKQQVWGENR